MTQKERAQDFLKLIIAGKVNEAYDRYVAMDFIHHNAYFPGDRASLLAAMKESEVRDPGKLHSFKMVLEEGDKVMLLSHVRVNEADKGFATLHICRFDKDGKIVELWDLAQAVPDELPNENGLF